MHLPHPHPTWDGIQQSFDEIKPTVSTERREAFSSHINCFLKILGKLKRKKETK